MSNFLNDTLPFEYQIVENINESGGRSRLLVRGIFQRADQKNGNGRIYERSILEREVTRMNDSIKNRQVIGEVDHPDDGILKLQRASHLITNLSMQPDGTVV